MEFVLWVPLYLAMFLMVLDATVMFMNYSRAQREVQAFNRDFAVGVYKSCTEAETALETRLQTFIPSADATCVGPVDTRTQVTVTMDSTDMDLSGIMRLIGNIPVRMNSTYRVEYAVIG